MQDELPKVVGGKLTKPYPIKTMGDVQRARVLPPPRVQADATVTKAPAAPKAVVHDEQAKSPGDYIAKRHAMQKEVQGRAPVQRRLTSR